MWLGKTKIFRKSKTVLYGYRKLHYVHNTDYIFKNIAKDFETRFDTSNYELERPLPKGKNIKLIGLMKDQLGKIVMKKSVVLRAKTYSYLIDDDTENKKAKETKKCVIQRNFKFENCKNCLEAIQFRNKINHLEKRWNWHRLS